MEREKRQILTKFLECYEKLPELWDVQRKEYFARDIRERAYKKLLVILREIQDNATVDDVKRKINCFRTNYRKESLKMKIKPYHKPKVWWFDMLKFLTNTETTSEDISLIEEFTKMEEKEEYEEDDEDEIPIEETSCKRQIIEVNNSSRNKPPRNDIQHLELETLQNQYYNQNFERDDAVIFSETWAVIFRKLSTEQQLYAKKTIDEVLYHGQLGNLNINTSRYIEPRTRSKRKNQSSYTQNRYNNMSPESNSSAPEPQIIKLSKRSISIDCDEV